MDVEQKIYLPGEIIQDQSANVKYDTSTLYKNSNSNQLMSLYAGILNKEIIISQKQNQKQQLTIKPKEQPLIMLTNTVLYSPKKGDLVIGVIKTRLQQTYLVDINAANDGVLGQLQFDNATKKNKPNLPNGTLVYCRVTQTNKFLGAKLSCVGKGYVSKNNGNQLGQLKKGTLIYVEANNHIKIQKKLDMIGKYLSFQIGFGKNGVIWFCQTGNNIKVLCLLNRCIEAIIQNMGDQVIQTICKSLNQQ